MTDTPGAGNPVLPPPLPESRIEYPVTPPRPRPRPRPTLPVLSPGQIAWLVAAAILADIAVRSRVSTLSAAVAVAIIAGPVVGRRVRENPQSAVLAIAAVGFAVWLPLRASTWLTWLNAGAVGATLLATAATVQPVRLRLATGPAATLISRVLQARFGLSVLGAALKPLRSARASRFVPVFRGVVIAIVPVAVLAGLLASADTIFAESLSTDIDPSSSIGHIFLTLLAAAGIAGLVAVMGVQAEEDFKDHRPFGATEAMVLLVSVGGLYAAFAVVQLLSALGRLDTVLIEQGITYSEYARSGFFQLLWVAGLTVLLLAAVRALVTSGPSRLDHAVRVAGAVVSLLTTLIVVVAIVRLGLYTDEFGQTTLRWYCTAFAWLLGATFIVIAVGHTPRAEPWLPTALISLACVTLFAVNVLNPEARVAEHNLSRSDAAETLDANYLSRLSADAWPVLLEHQGLVSDRLERSQGFDSLCGAADESRGYGPLGFNLALARLDCPES